MTVLITDSDKTFHGAGNAGPFSWTWRFLANSDIKVYRISDGIETLLAEGGDYTLSGAGSYHGGSVTLAEPLPVGSDLRVARRTNPLQETDIRNQGDFFAETHEDVFDRLTMICQDGFRDTDQNVSDISGLKNRVTVVEGRASTVEGRASALEGRALSLEGRVDDAEHDIDTLQHDVDRLELGAAALAETVSTPADLSVPWIDPAAFGYVGDGVADDSEALQAALDVAQDGQTVIIRGTPKITVGLIADANNLTIKGPNGYTKPMIIGAAAGMTMLTMRGYGGYLHGVSFKGDAADGSNGSGATIHAVDFIRGDGSKDVDSHINNCLFTGFARGVLAQGTNLHVHHSGFSTSLSGIEFTQNGADESRGLRVNNSRFHSMGGIGVASTCITVNAAAINCEIKDNFADSIYNFYHGPTNGITVDDNHIYRCAGEPITSIASTNVIQQTTGSVSHNFAYCNSPSYVGHGITLNLKNGRCVGNVLVGPRYSGINMQTVSGCVITNNVIVSPNFNSAVDGLLYDGIYGGAGAVNNLIAHNHVRKGGKDARSGINISSSTNVMGINWIDTTYDRPYYNIQPLLFPYENNRLGINKIPTGDLDVSGRVFRFQKMDVIQEDPIEFQGTFTKGDGTEFLATSIKHVCHSSTDGEEKGDLEFWGAWNGVMTKLLAVIADGGVVMRNLSAAPLAPTEGMIAMSDGTAGANDWSVSGKGLYRWNGTTAKWVFVG